MPIFTTTYRYYMKLKIIITGLVAFTRAGLELQFGFPNPRQFYEFDMINPRQFHEISMINPRQFYELDMEELSS